MPCVKKEYMEGNCGPKLGMNCKISKKIFLSQIFTTTKKLNIRKILNRDFSPKKIIFEKF